LLGRTDEAPVDVSYDIDFRSLGIDLERGRGVTGLRAAERLLETESGALAYDRLVIATGAEPVTLPGSDGVPSVHVLRTVDDAARLRPVLAAKGAVVVVGAGWIGAEFATAAREAGCAVTVVEAAGQPLPGALPAEVTASMRDWYAQSGAELRTGVAVQSVEQGGVLLADGTRLAADAVVVGIGSRPATGWLAGSGVELDEHEAVRADERLRTSAEHVYAVGDCASFPSWCTTGTTHCTDHGSWPGTSLPRAWRTEKPRVPSTTRCPTSGPSSSAASSSTRATTATTTSWSGAEIRTSPPGLCAGCATVP
jgi:3-phenylpropionate/trans-cinnamate dioxygenase ferredoxin reductase component